jgi:hypothetical protein
MNYKAIPKQNGTNLRKTANGLVAGTAGIADKLEGDVYVKDTLQRDWLEVIMMNDKPLAVPVFVATWVCTMTVTLPPVVYPDFVMELQFSSDSGVTVTLPDGTIHKFANGLVKISASNPTMQLV